MPWGVGFICLSIVPCPRQGPVQYVQAEVIYESLLCGSPAGGAWGTVYPPTDNLNKNAL